MSNLTQPQPNRWPVMSGAVPFLAQRFTPRPETGLGPWDALHPGLTVIVGPQDDRESSARSHGGTGKTRLAASFAARLWSGAGLDLLVWLDAGSRDSILTGYARALADIRVAGPAGQPEGAAAGFLGWLASTGRRWLVVLDGLVEPADAEGLWPQGPSGQTIVTTSLAGLKPSPFTADVSPRDVTAVADPVSVGLAPFSKREALNYLSQQLSQDRHSIAGALDLVISLDGMPTALALVVAYLVDSWQDCRQYQVALERYRRDARGDRLVPSWMLALERATQFAPDLAWPALKLAAVLGPAWIPGAVLTSPAACGYVTGRRNVTGADEDSLPATFSNLQRVGLVEIEPADEVGTLRMPAALQCSVRQAMGLREVRKAVRAAADATRQSWPESGSSAEMEQALRRCATSIRRCDDQALWNPDPHPLLARVGQSLEDAGMTATALAYWRDIAARCAGYIGARAPVTIQVRERLADAATAAGHLDEAVGVRGSLVADIDQMAGTADPRAIASRASLVTVLRTAGRLSDAISVGNQLASDSDLVLGPAHSQTLAILSELGSAYCDVGQYRRAIGQLERCLALRSQTVGLMHPETVAARHKLADAYRRAGQGKDAIGLYQQALAQLDRASAAAHSVAVVARENLAMAYYHGGLTDQAVAELQRVLASWARVPGSNAASTLHARANLAAICCLSGRLKLAITLYQSQLEDLERIRGRAHPDAFRVRRDLAAAYYKSRRIPEAVELAEATLADCEQALGPGHRETLMSRANLAHAYHATGMLKRASAHFDRALRDCDRALGPDDPLIREVREMRKRYLAGRQGAEPLISPPTDVSP
jgi:tetratricopeptide (TPR) repeat protein